MQFMDSQKYTRLLERQTTSAGSVSEAEVKAGLVDSKLNSKLLDDTDANAKAALDRLVVRAQEFGLSGAEFKEAMADVIEQLSIESSAIAREGHEQERKSAGLLNVPKLVGLRWNAMLETFGKGSIVQRAKEHHAAQLQDVDYMEQLVSAAVERRSFRKRYAEYRTTGGDNFTAELDQFAQGLTTAEQLHGSGDFWHGIQNILESITLPDPVVLGKDATGANIEVPLTPENKRAILSHLRVVLADEVIQMTQLSQMKVMETQGYQITDQRKPSLIASKLLGSGTLWGVVGRTGTKVVMGGALAAGAFGTAPIGAGLALTMLAGAGAGYMSQVGQYKFGRRVERKMDLALQGSNQEIVVAQKQLEIERDDVSPEGISAKEVEREVKLEAVKQSDALNVEMAKASSALTRAIDEVKFDNSRKNQSELAVAAANAYRIIAEVEARLLLGRTGKDKQDLISFGLKNRVGAQTELLNNMRALNVVLHESLWQVNSSVRDALNEHFEELNREARRNVATISKSLESQVLSKGESTRRITGALLGGTFAGLSSMAMGYVYEWMGSRGIEPAAAPTFPGNEQLAFAHDGQELLATPNDAGDLVISNAEHTLSTTIDIPEGVDIHNVVFDAEHLQLFDAQSGEPVAHLSVSFEHTEELLRAATLETNLAPGNNEIVTVSGKQFGLVMDEQGNLTLAKVVDGKIDIEHPVKGPVSMLSEALRKHMSEQNYDAEEVQQTIEHATQFRVESGANGVITVRSVYGGGEVAKFQIGADGSVSTVAPAPEAAVSATGSSEPVGKAWVDQLFADPHSPVATLLKKMGVEPGEVTLKPDGTFEVTDAAVKGEYLGGTESWRQTRLELLLEALKDGKIPKDESAEMIVARLERATNLFTLRHDQFNTTDKAIEEAFGKSDAFIKEHVLPWVKGPKSHVSVRWEKLVDALRHQPEPAAHAAAPTAPTPEVATPSAPVEATPDAGVINDVFHPVTPDMVLTQPADELIADLSRSMDGWFMDAVKGVAETTAILGTVAMGEAAEEFVRPNHLVSAGEAKPAAAPTESRKVKSVDMGVLETTTSDELKIQQLEAALASHIINRIVPLDTNINRHIKEIDEKNAFRGRWEGAVIEDVDDTRAELDELKKNIPAGHAKSDDLNNRIDAQLRTLVDLRVKFEARLLERNCKLLDDSIYSVLTYEQAADDPTKTDKQLRDALTGLNDVDHDANLLAESFDGINTKIESLSPSETADLIARFERFVRTKNEVRIKIETRLSSPAATDTDTTGELGEDDEDTEVTPEVAKAAMGEARQATIDAKAILDLQAELAVVDPNIEARWSHQYKDCMNVIAEIVAIMKQQGIFDRVHLLKVNDYFSTLPGLGKDRLVEDGLANITGEPNKANILTLVEDIKK